VLDVLDEVDASLPPVSMRGQYTHGRMTTAAAIRAAINNAGHK
jgi:hypothetical protein